MLTSMCTTISAGRPPTAIILGVGFLENVANFIVNAGGYLVRAMSSAPGTGDLTSTCSRFHVNREKERQQAVIAVNVSLSYLVL